MKKQILLLTLVLICQLGYSQKTVDALFKEFSKAEEVDKVKIGKVPMTLMSAFGETLGVKGIEVYSFDSCSKEIKEKFTTTVKGLKDSKFETMINVNEDQSKVKIMVRIEKDLIREMVILCTGDTNALIRLKGKINPANFDKIAEKHTKK